MMLPFYSLGGTPASTWVYPTCFSLEWLRRVCSGFVADVFANYPGGFLLPPQKTSHLDASTSSRKKRLLDFFLTSSSGARLILHLNPQLISWNSRWFDTLILLMHINVEIRKRWVFLCDSNYANLDNISPKVLHKVWKKVGNQNIKKNIFKGY